VVPGPSPRAAAAALALAAALGAGCATVAESLAPAREAYASGRLEDAEREVLAVAAGAGKDRPLVDLERSSVLLARGRFEEAADVAGRAASAMADYEKEDLGEWALAGLTDDTALAYEGDDHEKVLARALASVALLMAGQPDEARALALQVNREQDRLRRRPVLREQDGPGRPGYRMLVLGEWLQAVIDEQRGAFDEARIGWTRCREYEPGLLQAEAGLRRAARRRLAEREGDGPVVVLYLEGRGPFKVEREEPVTSAVFVVASAIHNSRRGAGLPSQAPVMVPRVAVHPSPVESLEVAAEDGPAARTETLLDVDETAARQARDALPRAVLRAVLRRAFKEYVKGRVKSAVVGRRREDGWGGLLLDFGGLLWTGAERADTRCWSLLPKRFHAARLELPAGVHRLRLTPLGRGGGAAGAPAEVEVRVDPARIAFVLVVGPEPWRPPWVFVDPGAIP